MAEPEPEEPLLTPAKQTGKGATTEPQSKGSTSGGHGWDYNRKDTIPPPQMLTLRKRIEQFRIDFADAYGGKEDDSSDTDYHIAGHVKKFKTLF
eukprot:COSAG05_NODE_10344_length_570_cov_1.195329_1_plen_93_part_10